MPGLDSNVRSSVDGVDVDQATPSAALEAAAAEASGFVVVAVTAVAV